MVNAPGLESASLSRRGFAWWLLVALAVVSAGLGAWMAVGGAWLVALGGTAYYLGAGILLFAAGVALLRGRITGGLLMAGLVVVLTVVWSLLEIHGKGWMPSWGFDLAGRAGLLAGLVLAMALAATGLRDRRASAPRRPGRSGALLALASLAVAATLVPVARLAGGPSATKPSDDSPARTTALGNPEGTARAAGTHAGTPAVASLAHGLQPDAALAGDEAIAATEADRDSEATSGDEANAGPVPAAIGRAGLLRDAGEWTAFGGSNLGQRWSPAALITTDNVASLERAWEFRTGDEPPSDRVFYAFQNTPLKIDDSLYVCSPSSQVFALDPATGAQQWHFDPQVPAIAMEPLFSVACRAVGWHQRDDDGGACPRRVLVATPDARLIALDAGTGRPCPGFGRDGTVDLGAGMANQAPGFSSSTSGPAVVGDLVVIGQQVSDNQRRDAPSGVVRAYDAVDGTLRWAFDAERADRPGEPLAPGETWPRGTPNVWTVVSADESLGLVYLATGNPANDHHGGDRSAAEEEFTAAVVAVDAATGALRWHFRTMDHDLWDYDLGAQPTVMDLDIDGASRRVVVQATKTGAIFVLDAATGEPLRPVERFPAPQGAIDGDWTAPDQPLSPYYPNFAGAPGPAPERIDERHAFGLTPLDALYCRLQFRRMRYEGIFTPPTDQGLGMLLFPGTIGGPNWGGISIDPLRQIMVTNHSRLPNRVQLYPREAVEDLPIGDGGARPDQAIAPQAGSPYGVDRPMWLSPLGVPCLSPPWGYLAATDLRSGALLWSQPLGTGYDTGPLGIPTRLKIRIGTPNIGGAVTTAGGLTFIAAAQDDFLRAFDTATGELRWDGRLPAGAQAGPMTYEHGGRQYVVIAAGGHARLETRAGDSVVAFALPVAGE